MRHDGGAAGPVFQLLRRIPLQDECSTGAQAAHQVGKQPRALRRIGELDEDRRHAIAGGVRSGIGITVADRIIHRHARVPRQRVGFLDTDLRDVERVHLQALARQPHAVASFTVSDTQHALTRLLLCVEVAMKLLTDLTSTDFGLMSVAVIAFTLGMAVWFGAYFRRKMNEDERNAGP